MSPTSTPDCRQSRRLADEEQRQADTASKARQDRALLAQRLKAAGGIATLKIICYEDTLRYAVQFTKQPGGWWDIPQDRIKKQGGGTVEVPLSAVQVAHMLNTLRTFGKGYNVSLRDQMLCARLYEMIGAAVDQISPDAGAAVPVVKIADMAAVQLDPPN